MTEECDDLNSNDLDGCSSNCVIETGFYCTGEQSICASKCNDTIKTSNEECDDGNSINGDGCSSDCKIEPNGHCDFSFSPNKCDVCGNNFV